ncbi:hypothetical protein LINPERPRIM_LOCUS26359 [Linum perenne]
MGKQRGSL